MAGPIKADVAKLRDRILWQSPVRAQSATGQPVVTWEDAITSTSDHKVWCSVETAGARDQFRHDQQAPDHSHRVTVRGGFDIRHDWRGLWNGIVLQVVHAPPVQTGITSEQVILCRDIAISTENA